MTLLLLLPIACLAPQKGDANADDTAVDSDTGGDDTDTADTTDDTGGDTDTDTGDTADTADTRPVLVSLSIDPESAELTTRDTASFTVEAHFDDGSTHDVTTDATWSTTSDTVVKVYHPGVAQPLLPGEADVHAEWGGQSVDAHVRVTTIVPAAEGDLAFNEVLADGTVSGDPNGDGNLDSVEDEFVEIVNRGTATVDLGGCTLVEDDFPLLPRHTFAPGTVLMAGEVIVVFGGGSVDTLSAPHAQFVVADNADIGLQYGLSLNNDGETIRLLAADFTPIATMGWGDGTDVDAIMDASYVLNPEIDGSS
jgi:hypothetical protein